MKTYLIDSEPFDAENLQQVVDRISQRLPSIQATHSVRGQSPITEVAVEECRLIALVRVEGSRVVKVEEKGGAS